MKPTHLFQALSILLLSLVSTVSMGVSLKEAAQQAVLNDPEVLARFHAYQAAGEERGVAGAGRLPRADVGATLARDHTDSPTLKDTYNRSDLSLSLTQMLFDGFATRHEIERFDQTQRVRYFELIDASENAALEAMRAYDDVLRYRELIRLAQENYTQHRMLFEHIQERVKSGVGRRVDLEQAAGRLALAESNLLTEVTNLHDVSARYQRIVGSLPAPDMVPTELTRANVPTRPAAALVRAYQDNPTLAAAQENIVSAQAEAHGRHARYMPRVDLRARKDLGNNINGVLGHNDTDTIEVLFNYNLYNGGADKAAERQYWERFNVARDLRDKTCRDIRQTLLIAHNDTARLTEQLKYLGQHRLSTSKAREAYRKQFDIGQRSLLDLLDTENEYFQSQRAYVIAQYDQDIAYGRTHTAMGDLMNTLGLKRLETTGLSDARGKAAFDPETVCPAAGPAQIEIDKEKLLADALAAIPPPVVKAPEVPPAPAIKPVAPRVAAPDSDGDGVPDSRDKCPGTLPGVKVDANGCEIPDINSDLIRLNGVNFDYKSAKLRPDAMHLLDALVIRLKSHPELRIEVDGHTDYIGSDQYNQTLSERRARSVVTYLGKSGVAASRLTAKGYGKSKPLVDNTTADGRFQNRRVELHVTEK